MSWLFHGALFDIRGLDCPSDYPVSVDGLQIDWCMYFLPQLLMLRLFLLEFFPSQRSQTGRPSGTLAVVKIIVVKGVVGIVDYRCATFRGSTAGEDTLSLKDWLE